MTEGPNGKMRHLLSPELLLDSVRHRQTVTGSLLRAYWVAVESSRERYVEALRSCSVHEPIVALPVRDGFTNPNAVLADFVEVLNANRFAICEQMQRVVSTGQPPCFVLVARAELSVTQAASPVALPAWLPIHGGATVEIYLEDLTWTADVSLRDTLVGVEELCELLFELDQVLATRIRRVHAREHTATGELVGLFNNVDKTAGNTEQVLAGATKGHGEVITPSAFRPSARGGSVVGRINVVAANVPVEKLGSTCRALSRAVGIPQTLNDPFHEACSAVLGRPVTLDRDVGRRFSRNLILTIHHCCQLITAAAHADQYARYPIPLLKSLSLDLRRSLDSAVSVLRSLDAEEQLLATAGRDR